MTTLNHTCPQCGRETYRIVKNPQNDPGQIHCPDCEAKRRDAAREAYERSGGAPALTTESQVQAATNTMWKEFNAMNRKTNAHDRLLRALITTLSPEQKRAIEEAAGERLDRLMW